MPRNEVSSHVPSCGAYVLKPRLVSDLLIAIKEALAGRTFVSPSDALGNLSQP